MPVLGLIELNFDSIFLANELQKSVLTMYCLLKYLVNYTCIV